MDLAPPAAPILVAVYGFNDLTGQYRPTDPGQQSFSRATSQGGATILVQALRDAGRGKWFMVAEREHLDSLLKERQLVSDARARYFGETQTNPAVLPPLMLPGVLFEGGVIGYDTDTQTGGAGAVYLGIGANHKYRSDIVTVYLRAVSVKTGEILLSTVVRKAILSTAIDVSMYRYVSYKDLLEIEAGITENEPGLVALEQAIQLATYDIIQGGISQKLWGPSADAKPVVSAGVKGAPSSAKSTGGSSSQAPAAKSAPTALASAGKHP
jgi:curli production assembly/transport component CsgG